MSQREAIASAVGCQSGGETGALALMALAGLAEAVLLCDEAGAVRFANHLARDLLGEAAVEGATVEAALGGCPPLADMVAEACRTGIPRAACELPRPTSGGRPLLARAAPLPGAPSVCLLTVREVVDDARQERDLWQAEKMSALGRLAASVAHEVRNPLGAVDIQLQLLAEEAAGLEGAVARRIAERVDRARAEMRRLDGIVQNFLRFSRPPRLHLEPTDARQLVQRMYDLVAPEARARRIDFQLQLSAELPAVRADDNGLSQALLNVLINAFQAVSESTAAAGPRVDLRTRRGAQRVVIEVADNGCGIPADDMERVLEYYYTTKDAGSGLGLSIAQGILRQHGGSLHLTSRLGQGTTVALELPALGP